MKTDIYKTSQAIINAKLGIKSTKKNEFKKGYKGGDVRDVR